MAAAWLLSSAGLAQIKLTATDVIITEISLVASTVIAMLKGMFLVITLAFAVLLSSCGTDTPASEDQTAKPVSPTFTPLIETATPDMSPTLVPTALVPVSTTIATSPTVTQEALAGDEEVCVDDPDTMFYCPPEPKAGSSTILEVPDDSAVTPDFTLPSVGGGELTLSDYLGKKPVALVFYRGFF